MSGMMKFHEYRGFPVFEVQFDELGMIEVSKIMKVNNAELERLGFPSIIVDLRSLGFIDTSGLGYIANTRNTLSKHGSELVLVCSHDYVLKLMELTRLNNIVKLSNDLDEAVNYLQSISNASVS